MEYVAKRVILYGAALKACSTRSDELDVLRAISRYNHIFLTLRCISK
jgi:hypothetical protein